MSPADMTTDEAAAWRAGAAAARIALSNHLHMLGLAYPARKLWDAVLPPPGEIPRDVPPDRTREPTGLEERGG